MHVKSAKKASFRVKNMENVSVLLEKTELTRSNVGRKKKVAKTKFYEKNKSEVKELLAQTMN